MPVRRCNWRLDDRLRLLLVKSNVVINDSRASFGFLAARMRRITSSRFCSASEAEQELLALAGLAQFVLGAPAARLNAVLDEVLEHVREASFARAGVDDRTA